jgi:CBS domain-containing protein
MTTVKSKEPERFGTARDWMSRTPLSVSPDVPVARVARLMRAESVRHVVVVEGGQLVGIVSDRDLRGLLLDGEPTLSPQAPVSTVMSAPPVAVGPETPLAEAVRTMLAHKIGALPVVADGRPVGILTRADALEALLAVIEGT